MPTRKNNRKSRSSSGGGWSQGPPLSPEQYYLTEYKSYSECYPQARPGSIQSSPNPELAQTPMAGGKKSRRQRNKRSKNSRKVGGSSCKEYFATRGGSCSSCALMRGGSSCREYFATRGGKRAVKGGRYMVDPASSVGGNGPNVNSVVSSIPCEGYRPMSINPHQPSDLISGPDPDLKFAGLSPGAALKGGKRSSRSSRSSRRKSNRSNRKHQKKE
jgi:hypothetical protein